MSGDHQRLCEFAVPQDLYIPTRLSDHARLMQQLGVHHLIGLKLIQSLQIHDRIFFPEDICKTPLWNTTDERLLSSLETGPLRPSGPGRLTFVTLGGGFTMPRAGSPADSLFFFLRPALRGKIGYLHEISFTSSRCEILLIIPRICGVSTRTTV